MSTCHMSEMIQQLRTSLLRCDGAELSDGQLLHLYISRREEAAFAALVRRHGPMVWAVCRRVLSSHHDVEDAFQATFLVLVRRATCIEPREMLANWLYGVAHRTARKARAMTATRKAREKQLLAPPEPVLVRSEALLDLQPVLDEELSRLPDKYRIAIVLCDLECRTRNEAARQLEVPPGTVAGRLARARIMLARRLARRGHDLPCASLACLLAREAAPECVPGHLLAATIRAANALAPAQAAAAGAISVHAAAIAEGVLKSMYLIQMKTTFAMLLAVAALAGTAGLLAFRAAAGSPGDSQVFVASRTINREANGDDEKTKTDKENLQGSWIATSVEMDGKDLTGKKAKGWKLAFDGDKVKGLKGDKSGAPAEDRQYKLDTKKKPREIDLLEGESDVTLRGIYELDGEKLKICWLQDGSQRPVSFDSSNGAIVVFEKQKK